MKNNTRMLGTAFAVASLALPVASFADTGVRVRAGTMSMDYSLEFDNGGSTLVDGDFSGVPVGITLIMEGGTYIDLSYLSGSGDADVIAPGGGGTTSSDLDRSDTTVVIGSKTGDLSVYVGYKLASTEYEYNNSSPEEFESSGFVGGIGYSIPFRQSALNFSGGLGILTGTYNFGNDSSDADYTLGYSLAASYSYMFDKSFSVTADYRLNMFEYGFSDIPGTSGDLTLIEEFSGYSLTANYTF